MKAARLLALASSLLVILHTAPRVQAEQEPGPVGPAAQYNTPMRQLCPSTRRSPLIISEIMYNPPDKWLGTNSLEFIEIFNTEPFTWDLAGYEIGGEVRYTFPAGTTLAPRSFLVVAVCPPAVAARYGLTGVLGPLDDSLPNGGGRILLRNDQGAEVQEIEYGDEPPWPAAADGHGPSLVMRYPDYGELSPRAWSASAQVGGSPGTPDTPVTTPLTNIVINEILAHTDWPVVGSAPKEFVELFNAGSAAVDLGGCRLYTDRYPSNAYVFARPTSIPAHGFVTVDQEQIGHEFRREGDTILLASADGRQIVDAVRYPGQENGVSAGRCPDGAPNFQDLAAISRGVTNSPILTRSVVINEIMFHPISGDPDDEYIELYNRGAAGADIGEWKLDGGVSFSFPPGTIIPAYGYLVVARNLTNLLAKYAPQLTAANTVGDYNGKLTDKIGETIRLIKPDDVTDPRPDWYYETVDEVRYHEGWGEWADGGGSSLELINPACDNSLGANWRGSDETNKAAWTPLERTVQLPAACSVLGIHHMQDGEFLLDDVEVVYSGVNRVSNPTFNSNGSGWTANGSHLRSGRKTAGGAGGTGCYHVRASSKGRDSSNRIFCNLSASVPSGASATLRAKVRWLYGWPYASMLMEGAARELALAMAVPANLGSPGRQNSRYVAAAGPAISEVTHAPILPAASTAVTVSCRVSDPDGVGTVTLSYRLDPATTTTSVTLRDDGTLGDARAGDGVFSGVIPGQTAGRVVAFSIQAADRAGASSRFPADSAREGLVRWGNAALSGVLATYTYWITSSASNTWVTRDPYSNEPIPGTFVYHDYRAEYVAGARWRGNNRPAGGPGSYWDDTKKTGERLAAGGFAIDLPPGNPILGDNEFKIDQCGQIARDHTLQGERHCYWLADKLDVPYCYMRFVHMFVNGANRGTMHDLQTPARDFMKSWKPGRSEYYIYRQESDLLVTEESAGQPSTAAYRMGWQKKRTSPPDDDYAVPYLLAKALATTDAAILEARLAALLDRESWMGYFAVNHIVSNEDTWGYLYTHNSFLEMSREHKSLLCTYDHDWSLGSSYNTAGLSGDSIWRNDGGHVLPAKLYSHPSTRRLYLRMCKEAAALWLGTATTQLLTERYNGLLANSGHYSINTGTPAVIGPTVVNSSGESMTSWIGKRKTSLENQVQSAGANVAFAVTSPAGATSTGDRVLTVQGNAPVEVDQILINSNRYKLSFSTITTWSAQVGLNPGANTLQFRALDRFSNTVGTVISRAVTCTAADTPLAGVVVINEIHYHPRVPGTEFVELRNLSRSPVDLSGWRLDGVGLTVLHGTTLPASGYAVLAQDPQAYYFAYTNVETVADAYGGALANEGETLTLLRPRPDGTWETVDAVTYAPSLPWPQAAAAGAASLQLLDAGQDNDRIGNWAAVTAGGAPWTPGAVNSVSAALPAFDSLWINEVMPSNTTATTDNRGERDPWIELYNAGASAVDLAAGAYYLTDDPAALRKWAFPAGVSIAAGARLLVWADNETGETAPGYPHAGFYLRSPAGSVTLTRNYSGRDLVVDSLAYDVPPGRSFGHYPESDPHSARVFEYPTPGAANSVASPHAVVYINEWIADNTKTLLDPSDSRYQDWFELYNPSAEAVNLGGYWINDENTLSNAFMVPSWVSIPARGFLVVWADDDEEQNRPGEMLHISFNLSKTGDTIRVFAPNGTLLDAVSFGPQAPDVSEGRVPDGVGAVTTLPTPTPGAANSGVVIVPTPPAVNNGGGATSVEAFAAVLNGNLVSGGIAQVWIYLGTADGASNKAAWAQSLPVGLQATGAFARAAGGLESARRYYYRCFASNVAGQAWAPTAATFTTLTWVETNRPSAPADLAAAVMSPLQVDLSWRDTATNETGFELQRRIEGGAYAPIGSAAANATGYSDMTVGAGTTYTYRVRASGAAGPSDYSNEARAEVLTEVLRVCACVADSYLYLDGGTGRTNCYGGLDIMYTDGNASHSLLDIRDALLLFDLSGLPALAPSRATLRLYCVGERYPTTAGRLEVHGVLQPWTEAEVTWSNRAFGAPWSGSRFEPGGGANYLAAAAASREAPTTDDWTSTWVEMDVTSLARDWLAARLPNYGLAVFSFSSSGGGKRFDFMTREAAINRPELHLTFSAPPPRPRITAMLPPAGSSSLLTWGAVSGAVYRLEYSANLLIPGWTVIGVQTATSSSISMPDPTAGRAPRRFYRTVRQ